MHVQISCLAVRAELQGGEDRILTTTPNPIFRYQGFRYGTRSRIEILTKENLVHPKVVPAAISKMLMPLLRRTISLLKIACPTQTRMENRHTRGLGWKADPDCRWVLILHNMTSPYAASDALCSGVVSGPIFDDSGTKNLV